MIDCFHKYIVIVDRDWLEMGKIIFCVKRNLSPHVDEQAVCLDVLTCVAVPTAFNTDLYPILTAMRVSTHDISMNPDS